MILFPLSQTTVEKANLDFIKAATKCVHIPETLKKPIDDLTIQFERLRRDKSFLKEKEYYYNNWVHKGPTPFIKL